MSPISPSEALNLDMWFPNLKTAIIENTQREAVVMSLAKNSLKVSNVLIKRIMAKRKLLNNDIVWI